MLARRGRLEIGACSRCWHRIERRRMARRRKGALARCAHILATNGFPDGQRELPPNEQTLDRIIIEGKKRRAGAFCRFRFPPFENQDSFRVFERRPDAPLPGISRPWSPNLAQGAFQRSPIPATE